jgi:phosphatidylglycerophosphatase A
MTKKNVVLACASAGGLGFIPWASGTFASLATLGLVWVLQPHPWIYLICTLGITLLGIPISTYAESYLKKKDPHAVVIDEVAGQLIALAFLPSHFFYFLTGFILFRILDVLKPFPAYQLQALPGGWGIMTDDIIVALYVNFSLQIIHIIFPLL